MNLIPFALSLDTKLLVDVADVQSGKKCGCICPSCNIPLVARKGKINEWHFAHDSQCIEKDQELSCDFSWAVAVKMMIKQLLLEGSTLALPEYYIDFKGMDYHKIKVTEPSIIHYTNPELKSLACDVTVEVKGKKLGIIFLTRQSQSLVEASFDQALFGVIAISIEHVGYDDKGKVINHLRNHLQHLLESKTTTKHWLYHKREAAAYLKITEQEKLLSARAANEQKQARNYIQKPTQAIQAMQWYCLSCQLEYQGYSTGVNPCPKCRSHFYRRPR